MTNTDPDQIRTDIERTRAELGSNVDALADKVTPSKIAHRQTQKVKHAVNSITDRMMGTASDARQAASEMSDSLAEAPHKVAEKAQGNPLAVGLIAFGAGWLAASLVPASAKEKELASAVTDAAQPMMKEAGDAAKEVAENLREPARKAATAVKDTAADAADSVKAEASSQSSELKDQATDATYTVRDERP